MSRILHRSLAALLLTLALAAWGCRSEPPAPAAPAASAPELRPIDPPAGPESFAPRLSSGTGGPWLTWLEPAAAGHDLRIARWDGAGWSAARTAASGDRFFANWADLPAAVAGPDGTLLVHWLHKLGDDTYAYGVELARSTDGGESWQALGLLHDDDTPAEHGFVSYAAAGDGGVQAFWLDGREMPAGGAMQLRTARLDAADGYRPSASAIVDDRVCECCSTDAAVTAAGPVVAYRDRGDGEVRDVAVGRVTDGGWSAPVGVASDGWVIHGCPVNGPAIAARGELVAVAWFTGAGYRARVRLAFSEDAGATFGPPVEVDGDHPVGRVDVELDAGGRALVSWLGSRGEAGEIRLRRIAPDGEAEPAQTLVVTTTQRSAGVPRMTLAAGDVFLAWVENGGPGRVRAATFRLPPPPSRGSLALE